jgi:hypothetical protein
MKNKKVSSVVEGSKVIASFMYHGYDLTQLDDSDFIEMGFHNDMNKMFSVMNKLAEYVETSVSFELPFNENDLLDLFDSLVLGVSGILRSDDYLNNLNKNDINFVESDIEIVINGDKFVAKNCGGNCNGCSCK